MSGSALVVWQICDAEHNCWFMKLWLWTLLNKLHALHILYTLGVLQEKISNEKKNMANAAHLIWFTLATLHVFSLSIASSTSHSVLQYSKGSLACKIYNYSFNMDCSRRNLFEIPEMKTTHLDLSQNRLQNIPAPFQYLHNLLILKLNFSEISLFSSVAFKGLHRLVILDLGYVKTDLSTYPRTYFLGVRTTRHITNSPQIYKLAPS